MPELSTLVTFNGIRCLNPAVLLTEAERHGYSTGHWYGKVNSWVNPAGKVPGYGYILLSRKDLDGIADLNGYFPLAFKWGIATATLARCYIAEAKALYCSVNPGSTSATQTVKDNTAYLVKLTDSRRILSLASIAKAYNVRQQPSTTVWATALTAGQCHTETLNAGFLWTWQTMLDSIWGLLPSGPAGSSPTLPGGYSPHASPENFTFYGLSAWDAYHVVLDRLSLTLSYNPLTNAFTLVKLGAAQLSTAGASLDSALSTIFPYLLASQFPIKPASTNIPATIRVYFPRVDKQYGTEKETARTGNWRVNPLTSVDTVTGVTGAVANTVLHVWDDLPGLSDLTGTLLNAAALDARAAEVAANILARLQQSGDRQLSRYRGIHTSIMPGSEIREVVWADYGDAGGMFTEYRDYDEQFQPNSLASSPVSGVGSGGSSGGGGSGVEAVGGLSVPNMGFGSQHSQFLEAAIFPSRERLGPPDLQRSSVPTFPRTLQIAKVTTTSGPAIDGDEVAPFSGVTWEGYVQRLDPDTGAFSNEELCYIVVTNYVTPTTLTRGEKYLVKMNGFKTIAGDTRPCYALNKAAAGSASTLVRFELTATLVLGVAPGANNAETCAWNGAAWAKTGTVIRVYDWFARTNESEFAGVSGYQGWCVYMADSARYEIVWMQHKARWIKFYLPSELQYTEATKAACTILEFWDGRDPGATTTVSNQVTQVGGEYRFYACGNAVGFAAWDIIDSVYRIVDLEPQAVFIRFTLTADMCGGSAAANFAASNFFWQGKDPGSIRTGIVHDTSNEWTCAKSGSSGEAVWDERARLYRIISIQYPISVSVPEGGTSDDTITAPSVRALTFSGAFKGTGSNDNCGGDPCNIEIELDPDSDEWEEVKVITRVWCENGQLKFCTTTIKVPKGGVGPEDCGDDVIDDLLLDDPFAFAPPFMPQIPFAPGVPDLVPFLQVPPP